MDHKTEKMSFDLAIKYAATLAKYHHGVRYNVIRYKGMYFCVTDSDLPNYHGCHIEGTIMVKKTLAERLTDKVTNLFRKLFC